MSDNPYADLLKDLGGPIHVGVQQSALGHKSPLKPAEFAWWWWTAGELHAARASFGAGPAGLGAAVDCFTRAARWFTRAEDGDNAKRAKARADECVTLARGADQ